MPENKNNREIFFSGKSSSDLSEGNLVIDLEKASSNYDASNSSFETSFDSEVERMLLRTTQAAMPHEVMPPDCDLTTLAKKPRKIGLCFPINPTSENLRKAVTVDEEGHYVWEEDYRDQTLCGHCGYIISDYDRQVVNWPCYHRSHAECQRRHKCTHWDQLVLYCQYKACKFPIIDDGDDLFNVEQMFFQELAPWRRMVTFVQLLPMTYEQLRSLEAILHNLRIKYGDKYDPTYLCHYRQPIQDQIRNIIIKDVYMRDLPMTLNGVKSRINRRRFKNGTEFAFFASHESEKLPKHVCEMDFTEIVDVGYFGDFEENRATRDEVYKKIGKALLSGALYVDFKNEFGIEIEFQSKRGFVKNFGLDNNGEHFPLDFDHFDEDDNEGRHDGRPLYRPPSQNRFHQGELEAIDQQNGDNEVHDQPADEHDDDEPMEVGEDILDKLLHMDVDRIDKCLSAWKADLESSIERIEANFDNMATKPKEKTTQTFIKGVKDRGVQATDLDYDFRDTIVNFFIYDFQHRLSLAERGYYKIEELKFMLRYIHGIPALKEAIFGFAEEPTVLVPKLTSDFDLDLATMPGFNLVHTGSFQFISDEDVPVNPKVLHPELLYYGSPSKDPYHEDQSPEISSTLAVAGTSSDASIESSSGSSKLVITTTASKVKNSNGSFEIIGFSVNNFNSREHGQSSKILRRPQIQSEDDCVSRKLSSFTPHHWHLRWHWKTNVSKMTEKKTSGFMMKIVLRTSRTKMPKWSRFQKRDKSNIRISLIRSNEKSFAFFLVRKILFFCDSSSSYRLRNLFSHLTVFPVKTFWFIVKSFHEIFASSSRSMTYFFLLTASDAFFDHHNKNAHSNNDFFVHQPTRLRTSYYCFIKHNHYEYLMLLSEIYTVDRDISEVKLLFISMDRKIVAIFSVNDDNEHHYKKAELGNQDIHFPHLNFDIWDSRRGTKGLELVISCVTNYSCISVLRLNKRDFRGLLLPQMVLFHIVSGMVEGFTRSMFRRERMELGLPREISWHQMGNADPPIMVKNGKLAMKLVNAPDMYYIQTTMSKTCYFLSMSMSHTQFEEKLDPFQMFVLANYLRDSYETRVLLEEKLNFLLLGSPGHLFVKSLIKHLDDCDQAYYHFYYGNVDMFDDYFAYGTIDDWHIKRINTTTLLEQTKVEIPDTRIEMFGKVQSDDVTW